ncbi:hypothetical protein [Lacrimispora indolis]|uniref:hypothetical protein n=1 Tax=Lacrimispora indolis TaxID=69825 RepID=UPI00045E5A83|nr:hypothetical protein [Lacrimispora indolis]
MKRKYLFIIIFIIFLLLSFTVFKKANKTDESKYLNSGNQIDTYAKNFMPAIEDLPTSQAITYEYNRASIILFETETLMLVVKYDEEIYKKEKEKLTEKYKFLDHKVVSDFDKEKYYIPEYQFSINNYELKVVNGSDSYKAEYPKSFGMIGISDKKKSIAYLYFYDYDLDYIQCDDESPMAGFVNKYFKYDF